MKNKNEKISRHCGRGPAIQGFYKEKNTLLNRLDPGSMPGMTTKKGKTTLLNRLDPGYPAGRPSGMTTKRAFTLIELLVVVLIIGILAAVAIPQYEKAVMKSRYATLMSMVETLAAAEEVYYLANQTYTNDFEALDVQPAGCTLSANNTKCTFDWGSCTLDTSADDAVACVNTSSLKNGYAHYLSQGRYKHFGKACWALSAEDKYGKLCEQISGKPLQNYGKATCRPHGDCAIYTLD